MGLDTSHKKTGLVVLHDDNNDPICAELIQPPGKIKGLHRDDETLQAVMQMVRLYKPTFTLFEGYAFGNRVAQLVQTQTLIRHALWVEDYRYSAIHPSTFKTWICNKGNAGKPAMALHTRKRWGFEHDSDDVVDAYGLAQLAREYAVGNLEKGNLLSGLQKHDSETN